PKSLSKSLFCTFTYVLGYFPSRMGCLVRLICPILADGCHANTGPSFRSFVSAMTEITPTAFDGHRALHSPKISFEFFPPKTEEMERSLWETVNRLAPLTPNFVSVTYGAGGSTRERTHSTIARILKETRLTPAAHLTCVGAPKGEIDDVVARYHEIGVRHIVALRGRPKGREGGGGAALPGDGRPPHRGPARRSDHRHRHCLPCSPGWLSEF